MLIKKLITSDIGSPWKSPRSGFRHRRSVLLLLALLSLVAITQSVAQVPFFGKKSKDKEKQKAAERQKPQPAPEIQRRVLLLGDGSEIPITEVIPRTEAALTTLQGIISSTDDVQLSGVQVAMGGLLEEIASTKGDTETTIQYARSAQAMNEIRIEWIRRREELDVLNARVTQTVSAMTEKQAKIKALHELWSDVQAPPGQTIPDGVMASIERVQSAVIEADRKIHTGLDSLIAMQLNLAGARKDIDGILTAVDAAQKGLRGQIFALDSPPLWSAFRSDSYQSLGEQVRSTTHKFRSRLTNFYHHYWNRLIGYSLFFLFLAGILFWLPRAGLTGQKKEDLGSEEKRFLRHPVSVAAFLSLVLFGAFFPQASPEVIRLASLFVVFTSVVLASQVFERSLFWPVAAIATLRVLNTGASNAAAGTLLQRISSFVLAAISCGVFAWLALKRGEAVRELERRRWPIATAVCRVAVVLLGLSLLANIAGNVSLADILITGILKGSYAGVIIYLFYTISQDLLLLFTDTRFSQRSRVIRFHRELFLEKTTKVLRFICWVSWLVAIFVAFQFAAEAAEGVSAFLGRSWTIGAVKISLKDILLFGIVLALSTILARMVRFFLEEELLPRTQVTEGAARAGSRLLHYLLVFLGFFLALGAAGIDLSRVTLLTGAFGVGIGFGLQNVVSNFISGIIISLERPIQVNDVIEVGNLLGTVTDIGFRSSTVRTFDGAAVIVPNSDLITKSFVNWSLTDRLRRGEIRIGVAYGTDPGKVLNLLASVVAANDRVLKNPAPVITFEAFGESSLDFIVRFWTYIDSLLTVRSELNVEICDQLNEAGIEIPFPQRDVHIRMAGDDLKTQEMLEPNQKGKRASGA